VSIKDKIRKQENGEN